MGIFWDLVYAFEETPWDTGQVPPELERVIGEGTVAPPGRALDVGCGTGTNVLYLARCGFEALGVDVSRLAVGRARRRSRENGVAASFHAFDVTKLHRPGSPVSGPIDFVLDIGCFHTLHRSARDSYVEMLEQLLGSNGYYLQYTHLRERETQAGPRPSPAPPRRRSKVRLVLQLMGRRRPERPDLAAIEESFGRICRLIWREEGSERGRPSAWSLWQRVHDDEAARDLSNGWSHPTRRV